MRLSDIIISRQEALVKDEVGEIIDEQKSAKGRRRLPLPSRLKPLFWDTAFDRLSWHSHKDFIIRRIFVDGDWVAVQWLRRRMGNEALRGWILQQRGKGLDKRRLRFWELVLSLLTNRVDSWLPATHSSPWERRWPS